MLQHKFDKAGHCEHALLVEVKAVSINPVDTKVHAGWRKNGLAEPHVLGWDANGTVLAICDRVSGFLVGDEVWYAGDITRAGGNRLTPRCKGAGRAYVRQSD